MDQDQAEPDLAGTRVFEHIVQGLLGREKHVVADIGVEEPEVFRTKAARRVFKRTEW